MKIRYLTWVLIVSLITISAVKATDYPGFKPVSDIAAFKKNYIAVSSKIQTLQADFKQNKTISALTEEITSKGKFWFKRNDKVRMDYVEPFVYRLIINGDKIAVRDNQKESKVNVKSNKLFQEVNRVMIDCMQGTVLDNKTFTTRFFENETSFLLELTPATKTFKEFFSTIVLVIERKDYSPKSILLNEPEGDKTLINLSNKVINGQVSDEVFSF
jgi:outer membrane lipoprotein-sorting protein